MVKQHKNTGKFIVYKVFLSIFSKCHARQIVVLPFCPRYAVMKAEAPAIRTRLYESHHAMGYRLLQRLTFEMVKAGRRRGRWVDWWHFKTAYTCITKKTFSKMFYKWWRFITATCFSNVAVMGSLDVRLSVCPSVCLWRWWFLITYVEVGGILLHG